MEGNKDEALKCLHLATKFLASGYKEKAKKFAEKSIRLFPSSKAEDLLKQILNEDTASNGSANHEQARRRRRTNSKEAPEHPSEPAIKNYTPEQSEAVTKIKNCKDYYEVLGVSKSPNDSELKKAYRKLALLFHPDKNQAPGATDAFKRISAAFETLKDTEKKQRYDRYGEDTGQTTRRQRRSYYEDEFEGDISPEDLFNMFFGGGFPNGNVNVRRGGRRGHNHRQTFFTTNNRQNQHQNENASGLAPLVQILPVLLIILFSLLSSFLIPEPDYSFQRTAQYRYVMTTNRYNIQYFVKDHELRKNHQDFNGLEIKIEREFIETLQVRCYRERQYKAELHHQARVWGNRDLANKANNYHAESCDRLEDFKRRD